MEDKEWEKKGKDNLKVKWTVWRMKVSSLLLFSIDFLKESLWIIKKKEAETKRNHIYPRTSVRFPIHSSDGKERRVFRSGGERMKEIEGKRWDK